MNRRVFFNAVAMTAIGSRLSAGQATPPHNKDEDDVRRAETDRFAAMVKADVATLDKLLAPELSYTHGDARVVDKSVFIAELKAGDFKYLTIVPNDLHVRVYGNTAVVTGGAGMDIVNKGVPAKIRIRYTNMQIKKNGSWQMVAWQATRLP
jgi:ketosteroid isomerase-like protein